MAIFHNSSDISKKSYKCFMVFIQFQLHVLRKKVLNSNRNLELSFYIEGSVDIHPRNIRSSMSLIRMSKDPYRENIHISSFILQKPKELHLDDVR
jgi:hypothetical protein